MFYLLGTNPSYRRLSGACSTTVLFRHYSREGTRYWPLLLAPGAGRHCYGDSLLPDDGSPEFYNCCYHGL